VGKDVLIGNQAAADVASLSLSDYSLQSAHPIPSAMQAFYGSPASACALEATRTQGVVE